MPSHPRKFILPAGEDCLVHTISRCVRRAWLCGRDPYSGKDHEHRRAWVRERVRLLAGSFAIEVCAYAIMSNHSHLVLWCRPAVAAAWGAEEVARRWTRVFGGLGEASGARLAALAGDAGQIARWRAQLGSVSWFMACLNEWIARRANAEDDCTGRFWEGRFKSQLLVDEGAVLACMAYVDLNPVRAKMAGSLEESAFTGVWDRLTGHKARRGKMDKIQDDRTRDSGGEDGGSGATGKLPGAHAGGIPGAGEEVDRWLCPMGSGAGRHTVLDIDTESYLALVGWTGRQVAEGKRGVLPADMRGIVEKTGLDAAGWVETVRGFGRKFSNMAGSQAKLREQARRRGQSRAWGTTAARGMYAAGCG